jgi:hypothetical protein
MGTSQLREKTLTEKHRSSRIGGGSRKVDNPTQKYDLSRNPKKEGYDAHSTAEPMMMMVMHIFSHED